MYLVLAALSTLIALLGALALPGRDLILTWAPWPTLLFWPLAILALFKWWTGPLPEGKTRQGRNWLLAATLILGTGAIGLAYGTAPVLTLAWHKQVDAGGKESSIQLWEEWNPQQAQVTKVKVYKRDTVLPLWFHQADLNQKVLSAAYDGTSLEVTTADQVLRLDPDRQWQKK